MGVLLAGFAAAFAGTGDFLGGFATRRANTWAVGTWNHVAGAVTVLAIAPFLDGSLSGDLILWGSLAGVGGAVGVMGLYTGFARSDIAVVSPIAAVGAATWPVVWSVFFGDFPTGLVMAGIVIGIVAIWLVSGGSSRVLAGDRHGLRFGLIAGLGFGAQLIFFSFTSDGSSIWALLPARIAGGVLIAAIGLRLGKNLLLPRDAATPGIAAGALTAIGNGFFIIAAGLESLAVVTVVAAMFPAASVLLARLVFKEILTPRRLAGLALALVAVALVSVG
jgi:drug/metabolite transporter (DMT)-like permease